MTTPEIDFKNVGRNDPCPCNSGKKFKRCHGLEAAPEWQGNTPAAQAENSDSGGEASSGNASNNGAPQFDPGKMDLEWLANFSSSIQRLPKGQLHRLQSLMQKAMSGKDVARELEEFQRTLPPSIQELLKNSPELEQQLDAGNAQGEKTELSDAQKQKLLEIQKNNAKSGFSGLWDRFRKK